MPKLILVGRYHIIEPLGLLYLMGVAKDCGWDAEIRLVKDLDFESLVREVERGRPDLVCFSIWTGYHLPAFAACDRMRALRIPLAIGGPHATYFAEECLKHADWVVRHTGFRMLARILRGELPRGIHFDPDRGARFPVPDRDRVYETYPALGQNPIKSIIASVGCPYKCSYCYAPRANRDHGGFELNLRPVDDVVQEARRIRRRWPVKMIYFQDDIFGFDIPWLEEFAGKWREQVGIPWHCQIRLELTRDVRRLDLFREGGCTGITLAIESGNDFLRRFVLHRGMPDDLIVEGCRKIQRLGFSLRTEQILAVPFSDIETDLETLDLNCRIRPDLAWTSILAPYGGTEMGAIAERFGFYRGNNDDLTETFFDRSVLRHAEGGRRAVEPLVRGLSRHHQDNPLLRMQAVPRTEDVADLYDVPDGMDLQMPPRVGELRYLDPAANARYCDQTVMLHDLFYWLAYVPDGALLGREIIGRPREDWTWSMVGQLAEQHLLARGYDWVRGRVRRDLGLAGYYHPDVEERMMENPYYFAFLPSGRDLAIQWAREGGFRLSDSRAQFARLSTATRHWLYDHALYRTEPAVLPQAMGGDLEGLRHDSVL